MILMKEHQTSKIFIIFIYALGKKKSISDYFKKTK